MFTTKSDTVFVKHDFKRTSAVYALKTVDEFELSQVGLFSIPEKDAVVEALERIAGRIVDIRAAMEAAGAPAFAYQGSNYMPDRMPLESGGHSDDLLREGNVIFSRKEYDMAHIEFVVKNMDELEWLLTHVEEMHVNTIRNIFPKKKEVLDLVDEFLARERAK